LIVFSTWSLVYFYQGAQVHRKDMYKKSQTVRKSVENCVEILLVQGSFAKGKTISNHSLCTQEFPSQGKTSKHWVSWSPCTKPLKAIEGSRQTKQL
jgi:hypothetical protein